jgi:dUTP pyrophosphatase
MVLKNKIQIQYLNEKCKIVKGSDGAFAFDVIANIKEPITVKCGEMVSIPLGIKVDTCKKSIGVFLMMRSGLAFKKGLMLVNSVGLLDNDFRGEYMAGIWNTGRVGDYTIEPYERIGQIAFMENVDVEIEEVEQLNETERGEGGFGHSGSKVEDIFNKFLDGPKEDYPEASKTEENKSETVGSAFNKFLNGTDKDDDRYVFWQG